MDVEVRKAKNGRGIFAVRNFAADEVLFEVTGPLVTCDEDDDMDERMRANTFRFSKDHYISPEGTIGDFQNHSCEPNAKVVKRDERLFVTAAKPINRDEEVVIDYSTIIAADDVWEMECACGSRKCRGLIRGFETLPRKLKILYVGERYVPEYILSM